MTAKNATLLALQSLIFLPALVFLTKGTAVMLVVTLIAGLLYAWSLPRVRVAYAGFAGALLFVGVVSAAWSIVPAISLERSAKLATFLVMLALLIHVVQNWSEDDRRRIVDFSRWGWCIALVLLLLVALFGQAMADLLVGYYPELGGNKLHNLRNVPNNGAVIIVLTAFPVLRGVLQRPNGKRFAAVLLIVLFFVVYKSGSSSALLGLCAGLLAWAFCSKFTAVFRRIIGPVLVAILVAMPVLLMPLTNNPENIARNIPNFPNSFIHRILIWDFTIDRIAERPVLGWGLESSRAIPDGDVRRPIHYVVPWAEKPITHADYNLPLHPHNGALQVWLELGLIGILVVAAALWRVIRTQIVDRAAVSAGPMAGFIVAAMAVYCVAFGLMQSWWISFLFLVWAALKASEPGKPQADTGP